MTEYVAGLLFSLDRKQVALIQKRRPAWQAGRWNAIGGHIEATDECPIHATRREFLEEAGISLPCREWLEQWQHFCTLGGNDWRVHFYRAFSSAILNLESCTDEDVCVFCVDRLPVDVMTNIPWLIQMALSMDTERASAFEVNEL